MNVAAVSPSIPVKPPEASAPKPPVAPTENGGTRTPQPTLLAALPPGQGTRVNQIA
jgi:hypothetical protein